MTTEMSAQRIKKPKTTKLIPDELIDQLLTQVEGKDAESIESAAAFGRPINQDFL